MTIRVLLVDDERSLVAGLQRLLRPHRATWEVSIATSAADALALMEAQPFDIVISDMRMPVMDGAKLLAVVRSKYPATTRIVLSGQTDPEALIRVLPVAHQFLSKPIGSELLVTTLRRVSRNHGDIEDRAVRAAIGGIEALPTSVALPDALAALLARPEASLDAVVKLVEAEPGFVAKLLQIVNAPFFAAPHPIASISAAVAYLGNEQLAQLVPALTVAGGPSVCAARFDAVAYYAGSWEVANAARVVAGHGSVADASFASGLLHDVGKLVMATTMPDVYDAITEKYEQGAASFHEAEVAMGVCGHARLGASLLDLWGLPTPIVEAVLRHHEEMAA